MASVLLYALFTYAVLLLSGNAEEIGEVKILEVTETSVLFDVPVDPALGPQSYIEAKFNGTNDKTARLVQWKQGDRFEVKGLLPSGMYDFNFRIGSTGEWSDVVPVVLLPATPQVIFRIFANGTLMIQVYRMLGEVSKVTVDKYRISYNKIKIEKGNSWLADDCVVSTEINVCDFGRYSITGLKKNTYYELRVEAHTDAGYGKPFKHKFFVS